MTLTTEQLRERIGHLKERLRDMKQHKYPDNCPNAAAYLESLKGERQQDIELLEELLANREAQPVAVGKFAGWGLYHATDDRFSSWIHPQPRDQSYLDSLKPGYANIKLFTAPPAPAVPDAIITAPIEAMRCGPAASYVLGWNACRAAMLEAAPEGGNDHDTRR